MFEGWVVEKVSIFVTWRDEQWWILSKTKQVNYLLSRMRPA